MRLDPCRGRGVGGNTADTLRADSEPLETQRPIARAKIAGINGLQRPIANSGRVRIPIHFESRTSKLRRLS